jgi:hypothetical protein
VTVNEFEVEVPRGNFPVSNPTTYWLTPTLSDEAVQLRVMDVSVFAVKVRFSGRVGGSASATCALVLQGWNETKPTNIARALSALLVALIRSPVLARYAVA